ncbi:MAG: DUF2844 domain-containing protein [Nitrospiraceae bacterium]|nr:DUF2844 domain-containing protein [Nitrospiraceae bacterium]
MKRKRTGLLALMLAFAFSVAFLSAARDARAVLGGPVDSVSKDISAMKATRSQVTTLPCYTVHEITSGTLTLREYVSSGGVVFGIAWDGPLSPNLRYLLGSYYSQYHEARQQMPPSHGKKSMRVQANDVVVEKWGHMRSMHGRAYVPALLPEGVSPDAVR